MVFLHQHQSTGPALEVECGVLAEFILETMAWSCLSKVLKTPLLVFCSTTSNSSRPSGFIFSLACSARDKFALKRSSGFRLAAPGTQDDLNKDEFIGQLRVLTENRSSKAKNLCTNLSSGRMYRRLGIVLGLVAGLLAFV